MTALASTTSDRPTAESAGIVPLENGDRLTQAEFLRRYRAMPGVRAELIEGTVYVASPVRFRGHGRPHVLASTWLGTYLSVTPGVDAGDNATIQLDLDNVPQPDLFLRLDEASGGQTRVDADDYVVGAPELVLEIAGSSSSIDLHDKLVSYRRGGVKEYIVWRTYEHAVDWLGFDGTDYRPLPRDPLGIIRSVIFPGLWLNATALIARDLAAVLATLQQGLATPEHAAFVVELKRRAEQKKP